eukprot:2049907-Rhodomonas_salina.1
MFASASLLLDHHFRDELSGYVWRSIGAIMHPRCATTKLLPHTHPTHTHGARASRCNNLENKAERRMDATNSRICTNSTHPLLQYCSINIPPVIITVAEFPGC